MSFGINDIVTLDNNKEYFLIDKNELDGITYFYAVEYTGSDEEMLDNDYCFFELEDNEYLVLVEDQKVITKLLGLFLHKAIKIAENQWKYIDKLTIE